MKISWTDKTWNPVTGCTPISAGCRYCYAREMIPKLQAEYPDKYRSGFEVTLQSKSLNDYRFWGDEPLYVFLGSMCDVFHEAVPFKFIDEVMYVIKSTQHTYQALTKRPERMAEYFATRQIPKNLWMGVTVEDNSTRYRMDILRTLNAPLRFLSCEPLLEDLELNLHGIDWVIVGGEHGPDENPALARPMKKEWVLSIKEQAEKQGVLFYFKQWGTYGSDSMPRSVEANGCELDGIIYQPKPEKYKKPKLFG